MRTERGVALQAKLDKTHVVEGLSFFLFRLCELSCRAMLLALFAVRASPAAMQPRGVGLGGRGVSSAAVPTCRRLNTRLRVQAVFGGAVFVCIFAHAALVLLLIRFFPANEGMWAKLTTTTRVTLPLLCGRSLSITLPKGDDMKLLVGACPRRSACI